MTHLEVMNRGFSNRDRCDEFLLLPSSQDAVDKMLKGSRALAMVWLGWRRSPSTCQQALRKRGAWPGLSNLSHRWTRSFAPGAVERVDRAGRPEYDSPDPPPAGQDARWRPYDRRPR